jgi:hypothetical protein
VAAPAFGSVGSAEQSTGTNHNYPVPASVASGDIIVIAIFIDPSTTTITTMPSGFAHAENSPRTVNAGGGGNHSLNVVWKRATAADTGTYNFVLSASVFAEGNAVRYTGCVGSGNPWDSPTNAADGGATTATNTPNVSISTQGPDRMLVLVGTNWGGGAWTPAAGWNERVDNANSLTLDDLVQATQGSTGNVHATNATTSETGAWLGALIGTTASSTASPSAPLTTSGSARPAQGSALVLSSRSPSTDSQPPVLVSSAPRLRPQPAGSALVMSSASPSRDAQPPALVVGAPPRAPGVGWSLITVAVSPSRDAQPGATIAPPGTRLPVLGSAVVVASRAAPPSTTDSPTAPVVVSGVRLSGDGTASVLSSLAPSADSQPAPVLSAATRGPTAGSALSLSSRADPVASADTPSRPLVVSPLRPTGPGSTLGSAMVLGSAADPLPPTLPVTVVAPGGLYLPRSGVVTQSRGPIPPFIIPPGTPTPAVVASAGRWPTLAPVATVSQPQRMHSCVTPRGFTGTTGRPVSGTTARPNTGTTEDPC